MVGISNGFLDFKSDFFYPSPGGRVWQRAAKPAIRVLVAAAPSMTNPTGVHFSFDLLKSVVNSIRYLVVLAFLLPPPSADQNRSGHH
jgi:hypothetical protein